MTESPAELNYMVFVASQESRDDVQIVQRRIIFGVYAITTCN